VYQRLSGEDVQHFQMWLTIDSGHGWFSVATAVAVDPKGSVFVADFYNHRIQKFTPEREFLVAFGSQGTGTGQIERPTDMAVDDEGNVYVVDLGNNRIQKFAITQ